MSISNLPFTVARVLWNHKVLTGLSAFAITDALVLFVKYVGGNGSSFSPRRQRIIQAGTFELGIHATMLTLAARFTADSTAAYTPAGLAALVAFGCWLKS